MAQVETRLRSCLDRLPDQLRDACGALALAGGKRLRPELVVRAAGVGAPRAAGSAALSDAGASGETPAEAADRAAELAAVVDAAVAVELLHTATLVHDDLLDGSDTRRGLPSVHRVLGHRSAVAAGDALIAESFRTVPSSVGVAELADALARMCSGEALEDGLRWQAAAEPAEVLRVAELKTGALLRAACRVGAIQAGRPWAVVEDFGTFGLQFGVALQLVDDGLDVLSTPELLGKPVGADLADGLLTMPIVLALGDGSGLDADDRAALVRLRARWEHQPTRTDADRGTAMDLLRRSGGAERTLDLARSVAGSAHDAGVRAGASASMLALPEAFVRSQTAGKVPAASASDLRLPVPAPAVEVEPWGRA